MNDWDDLGSTFKEVDVKTISLAVDSGRLQQRASSSVWMMWWLNAMLALFMALAALTWALDPTSPRKLLILLIHVAFAGGMLAFTLRQRRVLHRADELLLGPTADVVRGRIDLLDLELHAWVGRLATAFLVAGLAAALGLAVFGALSGSTAAIAVGAVLFAGLAAFAAYGHRVRVPSLTAEIDELRQLVGELEAP